jgi:hypothetical protein
LFVRRLLLPAITKNASQECGVARASPWRYRVESNGMLSPENWSNNEVTVP